MNLATGQHWLRVEQPRGWVRTIKVISGDLMIYEVPCQGEAGCTTDQFKAWIEETRAVLLKQCERCKLPMDPDPDRTLCLLCETKTQTN